MTRYLICIVCGTSPALCGSCQNRREREDSCDALHFYPLHIPFCHVLGRLDLVPVIKWQPINQSKSKLDCPCKKPCLNAQGTCLQVTDLFQVPVTTCPLLSVNTTGDLALRKILGFVPLCVLNWHALLLPFHKRNLSEGFITFPKISFYLFSYL